MLLHPIPLLVLGLLIGPPAAAAPPTADEARELLEAGDAGAAARAYRRLTRADPDDGERWLGLGTAWLRDGKPHKAVDALREALEHGAPPATTHYRLAAAQAALGERDLGIRQLELALEAGFADPARLRADDDLGALRGDERFADLVARAERAAEPCRHDDRYRAFDFWIGDWEVTSPEGAVVGTNQIAPAESGCLLTERWTSAGGSTGRSMNWFDPASGTWHQQWVSSRGGLIHYEGGPDASGAMVLEGTHTRPDGRTERTRGTWTPNGDFVVQHLERWDDERGGWVTAFKGYYRPLEQGPADE